MLPFPFPREILGEGGLKNARHFAIDLGLAVQTVKPCRFRRRRALRMSSWEFRWVKFLDVLNPKLSYDGTSHETIDLSSDFLGHLRELRRPGLTGCGQRQRPGLEGDGSALLGKELPRDPWPKGGQDFDELGVHPLDLLFENEGQNFPNFLHAGPFQAQPKRL